MEIVAVYLDLTAAEIIRKFDVIASQWDALGRFTSSMADSKNLCYQFKKNNFKKNNLVVMI